MKLTGKVAIVTGASRGLGKAMAIELAREGAYVIVAARTVKKGSSPLPGTILETVDEIKKLGGKATPIKCDVTDEDSVAATVKKAIDECGRIDILVNNAGITTPDSFLDTSVKRFDLVMTVNLRGTFLCCKMALHQMIKQKQGHIINISSVLSKVIKFNIAYGASKAAIERFTLGLAKEMKKHNIAVNALRPDFTVTEAVVTYLKNVDTSGWQSPVMWGRYAALVAAQEPQNLTGRILDEAALKELFGSVSLEG